MIINRRQFLLLSAGFAAGCKSGNTPDASAEQTINAGPASNFTGEGVYSNFRDRGFFVIRQGDKLFALSAICTHRKCKLSAEPDRSFYCPCHGSLFDAAGHVIQGPARRDLAVLPAYTDEQGQLQVKVSTL